jgi:hypothetical protein
VDGDSAQGKIGRGTWETRQGGECSRPRRWPGVGETRKHKLNYYRCIGSDGYRRLNGPVCPNRPIRQDYLDQFVWSEIIRLLEDPGLIQTEIDRRREAAQKADPLRKREEELRREQARVEKSSERLVTAYQEAGRRIGITI